MVQASEAGGIKRDRKGERQAWRKAGKDSGRQEERQEKDKQRHTLMSSGTPIPVERCMVSPNRPSVRRADKPTSVTHATFEALAHFLSDCGRHAQGSLWLDLSNILEASAKSKLSSFALRM